jgi:type II secretory pathway component PulF
MPGFAYEPLDGKGRRRKGILNAESFAAAKETLRESGHFSVEISDTTRGRRPVLVKWGKKYRFIFQFHMNCMAGHDSHTFGH